VERTERWWRRPSLLARPPMEQRRPGLPANFRVEQQRRSDLPAWLASSGAAAAAGLACSRTECLQQAPPPVLAYRAAARPVLTRLLVGWLGGGGGGHAMGLRGAAASASDRQSSMAGAPARLLVEVAWWRRHGLLSLTCSCERVATQPCEQTQVAVRPCLRSGSAREQRHTQAAIPCSLALLAVATLFARAVLASHALFSLLFAIGK
jgi:hypothetical protein